MARRIQPGELVAARRLHERASCKDLLRAGRLRELLPFLVLPAARLRRLMPVAIRHRIWQLRTLQAVREASPAALRHLLADIESTIDVERLRRLRNALSASQELQELCDWRRKLEIAIVKALLVRLHHAPRRRILDLGCGGVTSSRCAGTSVTRARPPRCRRAACHPPRQSRMPRCALRCGSGPRSIWRSRRLCGSKSSAISLDSPSTKRCLRIAAGGVEPELVLARRDGGWSPGVTDVLAVDVHGTGDRRPDRDARALGGCGLRLVLERGALIRIESGARAEPGDELRASECGVVRGDPVVGREHATVVGVRGGEGVSQLGLGLAPAVGEVGALAGELGGELAQLRELGRCDPDLGGTVEYGLIVRGSRSRWYPARVFSSVSCTASSAWARSPSRSNAIANPPRHASSTSRRTAVSRSVSPSAMLVTTRIGRKTGRSGGHRPKCPALYGLAPPPVGRAAHLATEPDTSPGTRRCSSGWARAR